MGATRDPVRLPMERAITHAITSPGVGGGYADIVSPLSLHPAVTFSRSTTGTYLGSDGLLHTAAINEPRYEYDAAGNYLGLLIEGQRTNLLLNSATLSTQAVTVTAVAHTLSFTGTGTITLSGASTAGPLVGTGATDRVILTFTPSAGSLTLTVSGTVTVAQLEAGAFATSYIPTTSTAVTRAADIAAVSTLASIGYNAAEGTMFCEAESFGRVTGTYPPIWRLGVSSDRIDGFFSGTSTLGFDTRVASVAQASAALAAPAGFNKLARAYKQSDSGYGLNGVSGAISGGTGLIPSVSALYIGRDEFGSKSTNGHIKRLRYYPRRLSNDDLQAITA